ncbi:ferritin-like domain-containing protein [bacterium M00.F.Ca.ET.228.01.1.1]|uniref:ferritin-like domain-containing protein n=1 Tax=Paraburkholderia phenoliruptrix TaxID=252970 RepID=UPI0010931543|nr:ferritin-like domain-containing protein [Paraburkholderia phenoliruptrix]TGP41700.1 ferritin-like domain-containing protein [bacterium M00.F.Ca.ET.228.01.1.1]TGR98490.1 ferritin-like domain-containing protein [bacterium M00.F.Ca.ET.191.01.1.1]TGU02825.1 ferritin-like domain-containing protein [bacterium M00.F.Ca.ET.155.01.1.1]MBW0447506.1 ferritin-like domain-containing protein [Paraburkholderia phenoliruptrix]MBW9098291.1 ferritin-like domain-containing protein [Paraburkholderia phenolirup
MKSSAIPGCSAPSAAPVQSASEPGGEPRCARTAALAALREIDPARKASAARALHAAVLDGSVPCVADITLDEPPGLPGRPARPELVEPRRLERRSMQSPQGRAVLLHALAHIEFNAINLALDAVWRFSGMPAAFYTDWLKVAAEEAYHFSLLAARLAEYGHAYGDFPAHDGLWDMCERTRGDVLARMALVPRTLEARGLDASPPIRARLLQAGDRQSASILDVILRDEIGHVLIGNRWFRHLCDEGGLDPHATYTRLASEYHAPKLRGPFNFEARRDAGFDAAELAELAALAGVEVDSAPIAPTPSD